VPIVPAPPSLEHRQGSARLCPAREPEASNRLWGRSVVLWAGAKAFKQAVVKGRGDRRACCQQL